MPEITRNGTDRSESTPKPKRKPVRRDLEKRRQQNLVAQRKYRDKHRERLERLEALATSAAQAQTDASVAPAGTGLPSASCPAIEAVAPVYEIPDTSVSSLSATTPAELLDLLPQELTILDWPSPDPQCSDISSGMGLWDSQTYIDPSLLCGKHSNPQATEWTNINCACSCPHFQMRQQRPTPLSPAGIEVLRLGSGAAMPDPYANHIRIEVVCTVDALYTLGMHIGINEELLCLDESVSPFFRFSAQPTLDNVKNSMIKSVQNIFKTLKPDLRPSSEQITIKHHPYIDILPFPTLRKNLIRKQAEIDEDEFFLDLLTGLVCWGGAGLSARDRRESTSAASPGTPWESRSWEAKGWFLKKYWALVGGEDGELARQSEWWRNIRGDDADVPS